MSIKFHTMQQSLNGPNKKPSSLWINQWTQDYISLSNILVLETKNVKQSTICLWPNSWLGTPVKTICGVVKLYPPPPHIYCQRQNRTAQTQLKSTQNVFNSLEDTTTSIYNNKKERQSIFHLLTWMCMTVFSFLLQLTPEELQKQQDRREQNRIAAQKCRQKRKHELEFLVMVRFFICLKRIFY